MQIALLLTLLTTGSTLAGTPRASSELKDNEGARFPAAQAFDGQLHTAWAEGELGDGQGAWLELQLDAVTEVRSVSIWPGNLSGNQRTLREYGRPKRIRVTLGGAGAQVVVEKTLMDPGEHGALRVDVDIAGKARTIRIDVDDVYAGGIYADLHIAEVAVNFTAGDAPVAVKRVEAWLASDAGQRAVQKNRDEVVALYDDVKTSEFGDRDALSSLMDRAGDGAPFLRTQVASLVPHGFRVQALPPDEVSIEALLKIKDSNAIPAIDRAALRSKGAVAARYAQYGDVFRAHQDLVGGASRVVAPWGESGFAKGALQSLGEPLQIEVDAFGGVYIADVGNSRVQRFKANGTFDAAWGLGEPTVTNVWFQGTRDHYASANVPSEAQGGFTNPVDLVLVPGKDADTLAVLDARGRVTLIEADRVQRSWTIPTTEPIVSGVGGEGFLAFVKGKLVVVWGNEGWVYSLSGEELGAFQLEDGVPTGVVPLGAKMGLMYGDQLVLYSLDGFRHGDVMGGALGKGFEAWDVTLDEAGRLWAVTDEGVVAKFKRPGKIDYQFRVEKTLENPRLDVFDDLVFVTSQDKILRMDALELAARQAQAAQEKVGGP